MSRVTDRITVDLRDMEQRIPDAVRKFDPSYVTRYVIVCEIVRQLEKRIGRKLKLLDVGGYNGAARDLLPDHDITIIDLTADETVPEYVSYDGGAMPFTDGEFDAVISCDTFEHVPRKARQIFMSELTRVSREFIILGAPFSTPGVAAAELRSDTFYQGMTRGESYIWLKEHREYGLPDPGAFDRHLKAKGFKVTRFSHTSVDLWEVMLRASFFMAKNLEPVLPAIAKRLEKVNDAYLNDYTFKDFPENGYRSFFVASLQYEVPVLLPTPDPARTEAFVLEVLELSGRSIQAIAKEYGATRDALRRLQEDSNKLYEDSKKLLADKRALSNRLAEIEATKAYRIIRKIRHVAKKSHG